MQPFDPMASGVSSHPIRRLPHIALRARNILAGKLGDEVRWAQTTLHDWIEAFLEQEFQEALDLDESAWTYGADASAVSYLLGERQGAQRPEPGTVGLVGIVGRFSERPDIRPDMSNTPLPEALELCIDLFFDETDSRFSGWTVAHFFAALALEYVERAEFTLAGISGKPPGKGPMNFRAMRVQYQTRAKIEGRMKGEEDLARAFWSAYSNALEATEAIRKAERSVSTRDARQLKAGLALTVNKAKSDVHDSERLKRRSLAKQALEHRHKRRNEARSLACCEWDKDRTRFPSAEKAGDYLADWLEARGYNYQQRTVRDWVRAHAKEKGVPFR